jgi:hypothetical protein
LVVIPIKKPIKVNCCYAYKVQVWDIYVTTGDGSPYKATTNTRMHEVHSKSLKVFNNVRTVELNAEKGEFFYSADIQISTHLYSYSSYLYSFEHIRK